VFLSLSRSVEFRVRVGILSRHEEEDGKGMVEIIEFVLVEGGCARDNTDIGLCLYAS
jgi:uncharacterized protein YlaN (UPF0358 family)